MTLNAVLKGISVTVVSVEKSETHYLDFRGLMCPLPILYLKRFFDRQSDCLPEKLEIDVTDPLAPLEIEAFLKETDSVFYVVETQENGIWQDYDIKRVHLQVG